MKKDASARVKLEAPAGVVEVITVGCTVVVAAETYCGSASFLMVSEVSGIASNEVAASKM